MFIHNIDPVLLSIGPLEIRYYGLMYVLGAIIGYFLWKGFAKKGWMNLTVEEVPDYLTYVLFGLLLGARLFYMVVYNFSYYMAHPIEFFYVWKGGMSFHGGLLGVAIGVYFYARKYKKDYWNLADFTAIPVALALALGRVGNFLNSELYGKVTNGWWGVNFNNETNSLGERIFRHPSQLYQAFNNVIQFAVLWFMKEKKYPKGTLFFTLMILYPILRFLVEFIRIPDAQLGYLAFGWLTMGQLLNIPMFFIGVLGMWWVWKKKN